MVGRPVRLLPAGWSGSPRPPRARSSPATPARAPYQLLLQRRQRRLQPQLVGAGAAGGGGPGRGLHGQGAPHARLLPGAEPLQLVQPREGRAQPGAHPAAVPARGPRRAARRPHPALHPRGCPEPPRPPSGAGRCARPPRRLSPPPARGSPRRGGTYRWPRRRCLHTPRGHSGRPRARPVGGAPRPWGPEPRAPGRPEGAR